jgi:hypothetical protein
MRSIILYVYVFQFTRVFNPNFSITVYLLFRIPVDLKQHYVIYILKQHFNNYWLLKQISKCKISKETLYIIQKFDYVYHCRAISFYYVIRYQYHTNQGSKKSIIDTKKTFLE